METHAKQCAPSRYIFYRTADRSAIVSAIFCTPNRSISLDTRLRSKEENDDGQSVKHRNVIVKQSAIKEAGKDLTYLIVVLIGLGVTGGLLYVVLQELFSSSSPNEVYSKAFNEARLHPEVRLERAQKHNINKTIYVITSIIFFSHGTMHTESKENPETGKLEFRYILVEVDTYPRRTIVIVDNR
uniref:Mitochondrial import inner membrane translocase subunit Tim21 n=1 Tax=Oncorhynchus tshawytscha TaxID=74940 RepID=A0AAZ3RD09_ONCTS